MSGKNVTPYKGELTTVDPETVTTADLVTILRTGAKIRVPEQDGHQMSLDMLAADLEATDAADVLGTGGPEETVKTEEIIGKAFTLNTVQIRNSDLVKYPDGIGIFAVLSITLDGQAETLIAGGGDVVLKAIRLQELKALPRSVAITAETTGSGHKVQKLVDAVQGEEAF